MRLKLAALNEPRDGLGRDVEALGDLPGSKKRRGLGVKCSPGVHEGQGAFAVSELPGQNGTWRAAGLWSRVAAPTGALEARLADLRPTVYADRRVSLPWREYDVDEYATHTARGRLGGARLAGELRHLAGAFPARMGAVVVRFGLIMPVGSIVVEWIGGQDPPGDLFPLTLRRLRGEALAESDRRRHNRYKLAVDPAEARVAADYVPSVPSGAPLSLCPTAADAGMLVAGASCTGWTGGFAYSGHPGYLIARPLKFGFQKEI